MNFSQRLTQKSLQLVNSVAKSNSKTNSTNGSGRITFIQNRLQSTSTASVGELEFRNGFLLFQHQNKQFVLSYWTPLNEVNDLINLSSQATYEDTQASNQDAPKVDSSPINGNQLLITDELGADVTSTLKSNSPIGQILANKMTINFLNESPLTLQTTNKQIEQQLAKWSKSHPGCANGHTLEQQKQLLLSQYEPMSTQFLSLVSQAESAASNRFKWGGLFLLSTQLGFFSRLIWVDYSWDVMEPITWCITYSMMVGTFAYYILYSQEFMLPLAERRAVQGKLWKLIQSQQANGTFDLRTFRRLRKKLLALEDGKAKPSEQTAFDTMLRSGITG